MDERKYCVYMHKNKVNGKRYIGVTSTKPEDRWKNGWGYYKQLIFWRAICKYGFDGFDHIIVQEQMSEQEAKQLEIDLIAKYRTTNRRYGYNITIGGDHMSPNSCRRGWKHTEESKLKMSKAQKGRKCPHTSLRNKTNNPASKIVYQYDLDGNYIQDFKSTREAERTTGISHNSISYCCNGKVCSAGDYLWSYTKTSKLKIRDDFREKEIVQVDINTGNVLMTFKSVTEAAKFIGITKTAICNCLKNKTKSAGGYKWVYLKNY